MCTKFQDLHSFEIENFPYAVENVRGPPYIDSEGNQRHLGQSGRGVFNCFNKVVSTPLYKNAFVDPSTTILTWDAFDKGCAGIYSDNGGKNYINT